MFRVSQSKKVEVRTVWFSVMPDFLSKERYSVDSPCENMREPWLSAEVKGVDEL